MLSAPQQRLLQFVAASTLFVLRAFGFWPYFYDGRQRRYRTTWYLLLYPLLVWMLLFRTFGECAEIVYSDTMYEFRTQTPVMLYSAYGCISMLSFSCNYFLQYRWFRRIEIDTVRGAQLIRDIRQMVADTAAARQPQPPERCGVIVYFLLYAVKTAVLPALFFATGMWRTMVISSVGTTKTVYIALFEMSLVIMGLIPNLHVAMLLCVTVLFAWLNAELRDVVRLAAAEQPTTAGTEAEGAAKHRHRRVDHYRRMRTFCELSDRLDRVAGLHMRLTLLTRRLHRMLNVSIVIWLSYKMFDLLSHMFMAYVFAAVHLLEGGHRNGRAGTIVCTDVLLVAFTSLDVFMLTMIAMMAEKEVV